MGERYILSRVYYNKMVAINVKKILQQNNIIAIIISHKDHLNKIAKTVEDLVKTQESICYITLNEPYNSLNKKYANKSIFFVDAVTKTAVSKPMAAKNVAYVESQTAFNDLRRTIIKVINEQKSKIAIFSNLSDLFVFKKSRAAISFAHLISADLALNKCKGVFICIKEDIDETSFKSLHMFVDKAVEI